MMKKVFLLVMMVAGSNYSNAQIISTIAGDSLCGYNGDSILATNAELYNPHFIALDDSGNIFIADSYNHRVRKINGTTGTITTLAGNGTAGYNGDSINAIAAELNYPCGIALDEDGNIYITDTENHRIRKVNVSTGIIYTVAGNGMSGYNGDNIPAISAKLYHPMGLVIDHSGNFYFTELDQIIRKVTASTGIISTVAGNSIQGYNGDSILATSAQLNNPNCVALDALGNIYISDFNNSLIRKVNVSTGLIINVAGNDTSGFNGDNIAATSANLYYPRGVAIDASGNIFISDSYNQRIRKVTISTGLITTVAGNGFGNTNSGIGGYNGDNIPATTAELNSPAGLLIDVVGNIYFADYENCRIRKVSSETGIPSPNTNPHTISLYPNPTSGTFTLYSQLSILNSQFKIVDISGRVVHKQSISGTIGKELIDASALSNGMYFWEVIANDGFQTQHSVLEKGKLVIINNGQ